MDADKHRIDHRPDAPDSPLSSEPPDCGPHQCPEEHPGLVCGCNPYNPCGQHDDDVQPVSGPHHEYDVIPLPSASTVQEPDMFLGGYGDHPEWIYRDGRLTRA